MKAIAFFRVRGTDMSNITAQASSSYQCSSPIGTELTSTPSLNHLSASVMSTSLALICLLRILPSASNVQSSSPYVLFHLPPSRASRYSYQNCTAILLSVKANNSLRRR